MITKDEHIKTSPSYMGYIILNRMKAKGVDKATIHDAIEWLREELGLVHYRQLVFSLVFLHEAGIIDFAEPYIYTK